jgi:hypothetical protein
MAQSNPTDEEDNQSGSELVTELINSHEAFLTQHIGSQAPTYRDNGTIWVDNSSNPWIVYMYDGTDDVEIFRLNTSTNSVEFDVRQLTTDGSGSGEAAIYDEFNDTDFVQFNEGGPIDFLNVAQVNFKDSVVFENTVDIQDQLEVANSVPVNAIFNETTAGDDVEIELQDGDGSKHTIRREAGSNTLDITNNADTLIFELTDSGDLTLPNGSLTVSGGDLNFSGTSVNDVSQISFADTDSDGDKWSIQEDGTSGDLHVTHPNLVNDIILRDNGTIETDGQTGDPGADDRLVPRGYVDESAGKEVFLSDGTFTVPSGVNEVFVTVVAGGGGGGGDEGNGGGAGGSYINRYVSVTAGNDISVIVGTGGAGGQGSGTVAETNGADGNDSSFGSLTATGGLGGTGLGPGSAGRPNGSSRDGESSSDLGGDTALGKGGGTGNNGSGYGAGGGGNTSGNPGGAGDDGIVIVEW